MPKKNFFPKEPVIPSRVTDCLHISYNGATKVSDDEEVSDYSEDEDDPEDSDKVSLLRPFVQITETKQKFKKLKEKNMLKETFIGKWMLFYNNRRVSLARGMTEHDYMWQFAKQLVEDSGNTFITAVVASTGNPFPYGTDPNSEDGVICCFTEDYRNKLEVKKAAEAIRKVLFYPKVLFYKTDDATFSGHYRYFGHNFVSLYKFTTDNKLYERDKEIVHQWNPVKFET